MYGARRGKAGAASLVASAPSPVEAAAAGAGSQSGGEDGCGSESGCCREADGEDCKSGDWRGSESGVDDAAAAAAAWHVWAVRVGSASAVAVADALPNRKSPRLIHIAGVAQRKTVGAAARASCSLSQ